jgi:hypothetical protein
MLEIGSSLRDARERRGLRLADAEAETRIRARHLEALEDEEFERLPAGPYARSFLREYADFLGLDGKVYAAEYDERFAAPEPEIQVVPARAAPSLGRPPLTATAIALAALVVIGVAAWRLGAGGGHKPKAPPPPVTIVPKVTTTPARRTPKPHAQPVLVLTAARGDCWLQVRLGSAAGATVYQQTLLQGRTIRFGLRKPVWVRIGAPWNLDATIGGRRVTASLPSQIGDVLATVGGLRPGP